MSDQQILCLPGTRMRESNPFTALLAESLEAQGACVQDFSLKDAILRKYDAIIIHWPDHFSSQFALPTAILRTISLILVLAWQRLRGAKIIRVVHDVSSLFPQRKWLRSINQYIIGRLVTGYLFLSQSSETAFRKNFPITAKRDSLRLFHPRFSQSLSPRLLTPSANAKSKSISYVGDIKPYKGLHKFLGHISAHPLPVPLNIHGRCEVIEYDRLITELVEKARAAGNEIHWKNERPSGDAFNESVANAELLLLPYLEGWNSGMALSALEAGTPILATSLPIFEELKAEIGHGWITTYSSETENLATLVETALSSPPSAQARQQLVAYLETLEWSVFAERLCTMLETPAKHTPARADTATHKPSQSKA